MTCRLRKRPAEDADLGRDDFGYDSFHTVGVGVAVVAQAPPDLDAGALDEGGEVRHLVALEGRDLMPGGLDDSFAQAALEGLVGVFFSSCPYFSRPCYSMISVSENTKNSFVFRFFCRK